MYFLFLTPKGKEDEEMPKGPNLIATIGVMVVLALIVPYVPDSLRWYQEAWAWGNVNKVVFQTSTEEKANVPGLTIEVQDLGWLEVLVGKRNVWGVQTDQYLLKIKGPNELPDWEMVTLALPTTAARFPQITVDGSGIIRAHVYRKTLLGHCAFPQKISYEISWGIIDGEKAYLLWRASPFGQRK